MIKALKGRILRSSRLKIGMTQRYHWGLVFTGNFRKKSKYDYGPKKLNPALLESNQQLLYSLQLLCFSDTK